jgi:hypothetical protein
MTATPKSAKELIKGAARQRRHVKLNLAGHLVEELDVLEAELFDLQVAEDTKPDTARTQRLNDKSPLVLKAQEIEAKQAEMADFWLELVLEQRPFIVWRKFCSDNPPREPDENGKGGDPLGLDADVGFNFDKMVTDFLPTCVVEPVLDAEDWTGIFDKAAPGDLRDLGLAVARLHNGRLNVPLSRMASQVIARQSGKYAPQEPGESPPADSTDGNP